MKIEVDQDAYKNKQKINIQTQINQKKDIN